MQERTENDPGRTLNRTFGSDARNLSYTDTVVERITETIRSRPPLSVDELGEIAAVLGCAAADLPPIHLAESRSQVAGVAR